MKEFYVELHGLWSFSFNIDANSKEAAIAEAIKMMDMESGSIQLEHIDQFAEEEIDGCIPNGPELGDMPVVDEFFSKILTAQDKIDAQRCQKAAEEGDPKAQDMLGSFFYKYGSGVPKDFVKACKWLSLGVSRLPSGKRQKLAQKDLDELERKMTPEQLSEAHKLAREWVPQPRKLS
jgi:hypothetical protein